MLTPLCRRRSSHLQRSRSTTPKIRRCHTPQHEAQISMLQRPRRVRPLLPPLGRAVFVGNSRHSRLQHPRSPSPNDTPPTPVRALQTPLGHKSDAHGNDNVVLRNAPSLQQLTETSSAASKARRHCCSTRTCRPPSLVLAETARPCENPSSAQPATLAKSSSSQPGQQAPCLPTSLSPRPLQPEANSKHACAFDPCQVLHSTAHCTNHAVNLHGGGACIGQVSLPQKSASLTHFDQRRRCVQPPPPLFAEKAPCFFPSGSRSHIPDLLRQRRADVVF